MATTLKRPTKETTIVCGLGHVAIIFLSNALKHVARAWLQCHMYLHSNENKSTSIPKGSARESNNILDLIQFNVCGHMKIPSQGGWLQILYIFIDHFSEYYYVFHLKDKIGIFLTFNSKIICFWVQRQKNQ